ncbi:MAG: hypothetical protein KI790_13490 [Cyclobacteriaceae bacterium]|nr:hypothetical protein [Cyclobacteriaceae bacterium HetDA_MAG_MS6]
MNFKNRLPGGIKILLFSLFFIFLHSAYTQNLEIKSVSLKGGDVIVNYDLIDDDLDHRYTLSLYSSEDNYVQPMQQVEGDIGLDQPVGGNKRLIWHAREELGEEFKGDVALEIKGKIYIPFVKLNGFEDINAMKRGRPYNITWVAGRGSNVLTFDLFNKNDEIVHTYTNIANVGEYELEIPKDIKPGKNYRFRITDQKNKEDVVYTPRFIVKRKVPMYVNLALLGLAGLSGYLLFDNLSGGETGSPQETPLLPDPSTPF